MLDAGVQKIVNAGFTVVQAEQALKFARNNVDRALHNLQVGHDPATRVSCRNEYDSKTENMLVARRGEA